jgi:SanA protein
MAALFSRKTRARFAWAACVCAGAVTVANLLVCHEGASASVPFTDKADAIVVLGAGVWPDGSLSMILQDRLDTAVVLWRAHASARILVSGDHGTRTHDELGPSLQYLRAAGVPDDSIFLDHAGFDTYSTFWRARRIFGASSVVVVTQSYHMPRALYFARAQGLTAYGVPADHRDYEQMTRYRIREVLSRAIAPAYVTFNRTPRQPGTGMFDLSQSGHTTHDAHE